MSQESTSNLLTSYLAGEHDAVWSELRTYQSLEGELFAEAQAVARETMLRVARNADRIAERLAAWEWHPLYSALRTKPRQEDQTVMQQIEEFIGAPLHQLRMEL